MPKFPDLSGTLATSFQLGKGGARVRSNNGVIEARNAANNAYADFQCETIFIGGKRFTYSASVPSSPATGDRWVELNGSSFPLYGWEWCWNGTYWLSPEQYFTANASSITASTRLSFPPDSEFNYYLKAFLSSTYVASPNDGSNYWSVDFLRANISAAATTIYTSNTSANTALNFVQSGRNSIALHSNISVTGATVFYIRFAPTGSPGTFIGGATLIYNYARK